MARRSLDAYRSKRDPARTPEPVPASRTGRGRPHEENRFVIQEHHATALHWDFRLERDGVLVSWALPKGLPLDPRTNHLAVHTEDHPLEYLTFSGTIPAGEYGGGTVTIWDHGTYRCEKWRDTEVIVVLHGTRAEGRYVLFATKGKQWMIHRMDPAPPGYQPLPESLAPMLATTGTLPTTGEGWAFEFKWDGIRAILAVDGGRVRASSRNRRDITGSYPELRALGEAVGADQLLLDSELVVVDDGGRPSFGRLQHRMQVQGPAAARAAARDPVSIVLFDLLHHNGEPLFDLPYDDRRARLEGLGLAGPRWAVTPAFVDEEPKAALSLATDIGMEGVVAKRRASRYRPGTRSRDWIKVKAERTQEVVIGGWTAGQGNRSGTFGALLLGLPDQSNAGRLRFVGKVGTGFDSAALDDVLGRLEHARRDASPFTDRLPTGTGEVAGWAEPSLVGEVRYTEWTGDGRLRHPVWRGLRSDKTVEEVVREP
ncbi:MAG: non-homologous end-joining DNA ligase [Acidimicrobiales bacterium]